MKSALLFIMNNKIIHIFWDSVLDNIILFISETRLVIENLQEKQKSVDLMRYRIGFLLYLILDADLSRSICS
jgi:hypothetical protein